VLVFVACITSYFCVFFGVQLFPVTILYCISDMCEPCFLTTTQFDIISLVMPHYDHVLPSMFSFSVIQVKQLLHCQYFTYI